MKKAGFKCYLLALWRWLHRIGPMRLQQSMDRFERRIIVRNMKKRGSLKLNLGSGNWFRWDYVNIDKYNKADEMEDICRLTKYKANSVDEILVDHVLEHLARKELPKALEQWYRVLKPGGKLVIRCPHFGLYVREWLEEAEDDCCQEWSIINIFGHDEEGMYHKNGFTLKTLSDRVQKAGFTIRKLEITDNSYRFSKKSPHYREDGDIYCEGLKPPVLKWP